MLVLSDSIRKEKKKKFLNKYLHTVHTYVMEDKKAAKKIIKRAKKHPNWYTAGDVKFAKMVKKRIKAEKKAQKEAAKSD